MNRPPCPALHFRYSAAVLAVGITAFSTTMAADDPLPTRTIPAPIGIQLKTESFNEQTISTVHEMGFRVIRRGVYWNAAEKEKGVYDFSAWDKEFAHAKSLGVKVVGCLFNGNKLYEDDGFGGVKTEAGRKGFAQFAAAAAAHFKDQDILWEVWNEPNVRTFWRKNGTHNSEEFAEEYTALVKETVPAMLIADPEAFVMAGSVSNYWEPSYQWTEFCFKKGILKTGIRGWSVHPYGVKTPEEFAVGHERTRALMKANGVTDMPLLDTERGFSIGKTTGGAMPDEGWSGGSKERALEFQSWHLVRQYMIDLLYDIRLTIWYEWGGNEFGIDKSDIPGHIAAKVMIDQLTGYKLERRLKSNSTLDYALLFTSAKGEQRLVAWTAPPAGGTPEEAKNHPASIKLLKPASDGSFTLTSINGTSGKSEVKDGAFVLELSGAPQYVAVPADVELGDVTSLAPAPEPAKPQAEPAGKDLGLFGPDHTWTFSKNTGDGSFSVTKEDSTPIGVVTFDFTNSKAAGALYVLATSPVDVPGEPTSLGLRARSAVRQPLTFRVVDSTGQTLQYKSKLAGTGAWESITIPLNKKLEHWDGANDGIVHFPIKQAV